MHCEQDLYKSSQMNASIIELFVRFNCTLLLSLCSSCSFSLLSGYFLAQCLSTGSLNHKYQFVQFFCQLVLLYLEEILRSCWVFSDEHPSTIDVLFEQWTRSQRQVLLLKLPQVMEGSFNLRAKSSTGSKHGFCRFSTEFCYKLDQFRNQILLRGIHMDLFYSMTNSIDRIMILVTYISCKHQVSIIFLVHRLSALQQSAPFTAVFTLPVLPPATFSLLGGQ